MKRLLIPLLLLLTFLLLGYILVRSKNQKILTLTKNFKESEKTVALLKDDIKVKEATISSLSKELEGIRGTVIYKELKLIKDTLINFKKLKDKVNSYQKLGVKTESVADKFPILTDLLLELKFEEASSSIKAYDDNLEKLYEQKKEEERKALEELQRRYTQVLDQGGYIRYSVRTDVGVFLADILVADLNKVRVITDTANDSDCKRDCALLTLASFVSRNGGFAGINGSYYCPPEYPQCSDKKNSFDFPVYNSRLGKWINKKNLFWDNRALITFRGNSGSFYKFEKSYSTGTSVDAGLAMVPGLLQNGSVIVGSYKLEAKEQIRSTRSSIGFSGSKVYAITARGVNTYELAYVQKAVGAKNALALDGGGSINFYYNGVYYAGPGRAQANSIIFKYR
ncbi:hypothetical protein A2716_03865 [candidate division WWE3 bacterium RIFCSPHIGHO2_01_FULL_40_23]|uniref:Phosphodiester glycosidase domain-containing protein n=1 Tax=candidate division WWE3 bacterium RIFCSPLOWO2_01_FULL_41_18 TaxID=1802625 RepID=A0A1F4VCP9_UNCKA|nr:MAG: hypothetical protein A2716_03865 [candidate division WWE3 bacterium RIFCSPHIGHO2_01_FULL_40_23]OGC55016.1 MAG: hypothetical protein A3A78_03475 [candidate division WWE3 bacterium RIFCSPLOWO2_01_FULL_41_18]